jgi:CheY-like chemotaxis protein
VDAIGKSAKSLMTIINDILDFSKLETGKMELRPVNFDPLEAVDDVAALFAAKAEDKGVTLVVSCAGGLPQRVRGDALRFRQIVFNLVNNAIKYTDHGDAEIRLSMGPLSAGRATLTVEVQDTGRGIAADRLSRIFDKFSSGLDAGMYHSEGLGLGLATTEGLVRLFGGKIGVESEVGKGSVFRVELPFDCLERREDEEMVLSVDGASVLVVDAAAVSRNSLVATLAGWGIDASGSETVDEALDILDVAHEANLAVDAVVVSGALPRKGARALVRALAADARFSAVPVVLLTSVLPEGLHAAAEISAEAQLQRPVRASLLLGALCDVLAGRRKAQAAPPAKPERTKPPIPEARKEKMDILIAEDNEVNVLVYEQILSSLGCNYRVAGNGKEAVEMWRRLNPDIVLMDISMPVMDGYAATSAIRADEARLGLTRTPIIGVTAHLFDNDRNDCLDAGMDDYLAKPISQDHLTSMIEIWRAVAGGTQNAPARVNRSA